MPAHQARSHLIKEPPIARSEQGVFNSALLQFGLPAQQLRNHSSLHSISADWIIFSR